MGDYLTRHVNMYMHTWKSRKEPQREVNILQVKSTSDGSEQSCCNTVVKGVKTREKMNIR
jgi:hypothetical protein